MTQQPNSLSPHPSVKRQPTVVKYGAWLADVEAFLDDLAGCSLEGRRAAALLERRAQLNLMDDRRR